MSDSKKKVLPAGTKADLGDGVKTLVNGNILTITINLDGDFGASQSGKTDIVASTRGGVQVPGTDGLILSLNAYTKRR